MDSSSMQSFSICKDDSRATKTSHKSRSPEILTFYIVGECEKAQEIKQAILPLPLKISHPIYCQSMRDIVICIIGFDKREEKENLKKYVKLIRNMGGAIRATLTESCTHVISTTTQHKNYRLAVGMGRPIMSESWVLECWERRNVLSTSAMSDDLISFMLKPFHGLVIYFHGFSNLETTHMQEQAKLNGAEIVEHVEFCTHAVVDKNWLWASEDALPVQMPEMAHRVTSEWFWMSIQLNVCANENLYVICCQHSNNHQVLKPCNTTSPSFPNNRAKSRRSSVFGRRSTVNVENRLSVSQGSFLDASGDVSSILADHVATSEDIENFVKTPQRCMSKRQQVCIELLQTENNYFQVLDAIIKIFKRPLEMKPDLIVGEILDSTERNLIFGRIEPIFDVHGRIKADLASAIMEWNENRCIGDIWLKYKEELLKSYPPFVNFFEQTKETLIDCDKNKPRFHAFLKVCQTKPECQRQSLQELLIRPVQRLPSVILLLNDLLKRTEKLNPDHSSLQKAVESLKKVLTHMNNEKGKTERQLKMFDIINDIKNCPADLLNSQRTLVSLAEVTEMSNGIARKGANLTLYVFNDCLEFAEKRPTALKGEHSRKHVDLLFLSSIRRIVSVGGTAEASNIFCLTVREALLENHYPFQFTNFTTKQAKYSFLNALCAQVAIVSGRVGFEVQEFDISCDQTDSDLGRSVFKAVKRAQSLTRKLSRNVSKSNSLQRAVSQIFTSLNGTMQRFSSRTNLRPNVQEYHRAPSRMSTITSPT